MDFLSQENVRANDNIRIEPQEYIQSQYSASPAICTILADFRTKIKCDVDFTIFVKKLVDIDTAEGTSLDNIGRIVGITRTLELDDGSLVLLTDDQYRRLLKYKMLANITDSSQDNINRLLSVLFDGSDDQPMLFTAVQESQDGDMYYNSKPMHVRWVVGSSLSEVDLALFRKAGTIMLGAGVGFDVIAVDMENTFGFLGQELQPFNQGIFWDGSYIDM